MDDDLFDDVKPDICKLFSGISELEGADNLDPFYFETDLAALKNNSDYITLLNCLVLLHSQRVQACQDIDILVNKKKEALSDPIAFVRRLKSKDRTLNFPKPLSVAEVPNINWDDYIDVSKKVFHSAEVSQGGSQAKSKCDHFDVKSEAKLDIRSKRKSLLNPTTYNKPWTAEEQKTLDTLLVKYPPEKYEAKRWQKITQELKTGMYQQVASRVQKYCLKLAKQGLPIPSKLPSTSFYKKKSSRRPFRAGTFGFSHSTFHRFYEPGVDIPE